MISHSVQNLVEAAVYAHDLDKAESFYQDVLSLELIDKEPGRHIFFRTGQGVLLVFNPTTTTKGGRFPPHGTNGPGHVALGILFDALQFWRKRLQENSVVIEKEATWPLGGCSLYFRDPAGNSIELVTPGCWGLPSGW
jgi:catechol 2,3-dioxygenase-like lactoylglutathione lyase family enzyme